MNGYQVDLHKQYRVLPMRHCGMHGQAETSVTIFTGLPMTLCLLIIQKVITCHQSLFLWSIWYHKTSWTCPSSTCTFRKFCATTWASRTPRKWKLDLRLGHVQLVLKNHELVTDSMYSTWKGREVELRPRSQHG